MLFDDYETEYLVVTKLFCEKYDLPFNPQAANNAAMTEQELTILLRGKYYKSTEEVQDAFMGLIVGKYKLELKKILN